MARLETLPILNDLLSITSHMAIDHSAGSHTMVSGAAGKIIRVHQLMLKADDDATITFLSGSTALCGAMPIFAVATGLAGIYPRSNDGAIIAGFSPIGWFACAAGEDFKMTTTGGDVSGSLAYSILAA